MWARVRAWGQRPTPRWNVFAAFVLFVALGIFTVHIQGDVTQTRVDVLQAQANEATRHALKACLEAQRLRAGILSIPTGIAAAVDDVEQTQTVDDDDRALLEVLRDRITESVSRIVTPRDCTAEQKAVDDLPDPDVKGTP